MDRKQETALITGASRGIGLEFTKILASMGYNLVIVSRSKNKLEEIKSDFENIFNVNITPLPMDIAETGASIKLFRECQKRHLEIDILINNAGIGMTTKDEYGKPEKLITMLNLNITSLTLLSRLFGKQMMERKHGYILNMASMAGQAVAPQYITYGATKNYVLYFSESLHYEMKPHGVSVTAVSPGMVDTGFFDNADMNVPQSKREKMMKPKEVAELSLQAMFDKKKHLITGWDNKLRMIKKKLMPSGTYFRYKS